MGQFKLRLVNPSLIISKNTRITLDALDKECFPGEIIQRKSGNYWWIAYDQNKKPVGFAGLTKVSNRKAFFCRAGVLPQYRKQGLHKRLIVTRIKYAKKLGFKEIITYTVTEAVTSVNNLTKFGFKMYTPKKHWAELAKSDTLYWKLCLQNN